MRVRLNHTSLKFSLTKMISTLLSKNVASRRGGGQPNSDNVSILGAYGPPTHPYLKTQHPNIVKDFMASFAPGEPATNYHECVMTNQPECMHHLHQRWVRPCFSANNLHPHQPGPLLGLEIYILSLVHQN